MQTTGGNIPITLSVFVLEGDVKVGGNELHRRDGLGVWEIDSLNFKAKDNTELLLMEVPMTL